uniref:Follistatin-like domain-containing protein n=2 Tax=Meloidogyne TaxID=189290 RepID=A0A914L808_MELIC
MLFISSFILLILAGSLNASRNEIEELLDEFNQGKAGREIREQSRPVTPVPDPCDQHVCGWGKECVVDKKGRPVCECISKCPDLEDDPLDKVCASNNQTFASLCHLYRQRCVCKKRSGFENEFKLF